MAAFTKQFALLRETAAMALDTLRANKMRSALTVLGVVIGVTSIVGMTSLIRGFDQSLRNSIKLARPEHDFVQKFGGLSFSSGASFIELVRRPNITVDDMRSDQAAVRRRSAWSTSGWAAGPGSRHGARVLSRRAHAAAADHGHDRALRRDQLREDHAGRSFTEQEVQRAQPRGGDRLRPVRGAVRKAGIDPIGKKVRIGAVEYTVIGVIGKRPGPAASSLGQDDFAIIPYTTFRKQFGIRDGRRAARSAAPRHDRRRAAREASRARRRCARSRRSCASATV